MKKYVKARIDIGYDGEIIPLMITDQNGKVYRIDRIIQISHKGPNNTIFNCRSGKLFFALHFEEYSCYLEDEFPY